MRQKQTTVKQIVRKHMSEHPYKKYESHRYWRLLNKGIAHLIENEDLVEKAARPHIVGYLCKLLLSSPKKRART
jgi:hypothetical protein